MELYLPGFLDCSLGPILLTWFDFNPSMDKYLHPLSCMGWNYLSIPKLQRYNRWIPHTFLGMWLWRHQNGSISPLPAISLKIRLPSVNSPHKGSVMRTLMFLRCGSSYDIKQTVDWPVFMWDYMTSMWRHPNDAVLQWWSFAISGCSDWHL